MNLYFPPIPSSFPFPTISSSSSNNKRHQFRRKPPPSPSRPRPTPLLKTQSQPQTKLQALESVLTNLESSLKNGIPINDPQIYASLLETSFQLNATNYVPRIHRLIPPQLLRKNVGISSKLVRLYASLGEIEKAHEVFDLMPDRNSSAFPWNSLISGYTEKCLYEDAIALYFQMVEEGIEPDLYTFPRVLKACAGIGMIQVGEEIHRHLIRFGFGDNVFALNALVDMYAKCGDIIRSRKAFDAIDGKDLVSWNSMIIGYAKHGLTTEALSILQEMMAESSFQPDSITVSSLLSCDLGYKTGREFHGWIIRRGMDSIPSIGNSLIVFYNRDLNKVRWLFESMPDKDVVSWNSIISAHSKSRTPLAIEYFNRMTVSHTPDDITFTLVLATCARLGLVEDGERIYLMMTEKYGIRASMEHYGCMVNLYARAGLIDEAYEFIKTRMDVDAGATVWGALLYGCYVHGNVGVGEIAAGHLFELEPEGEHNFELLVKIYEKEGRIEDAERIKEMGRERGLEL